MTDLLIPPSHRDLPAPPARVTFATLGPTGYPQVTAVWAVLDGRVTVTVYPARVVALG